MAANDELAANHAQQRMVAGKDERGSRRRSPASL